MKKDFTKDWYKRGYYDGRKTGVVVASVLIASAVLITFLVYHTIK